MKTQPNSARCCPQFDPAPWDGKTVEWDHKKFIKGHTFTFFHIPLRFGALMTRLVSLADRSAAKTADQLCLSDHTSKWNVDAYLAVEKEVPGAENVTLSGKFLSKVYEGPYKDAGKWCDEFDAYAKAKGIGTGKKYMWYTTCPKCAAAYGKNYTVLFGRLNP